MIFATCHNNRNQSCISPLSGRTSRETRPLASVKHLLDEPLHRRYRRKLLSNPDTTSWHTLNSKTCKTSSEFREELENDGIACADKQSQQNPTKSIHTPHQPLPTTCAVVSQNRIFFVEPTSHRGASSTLRTTSWKVCHSDRSEHKWCMGHRWVNLGAGWIAEMKMPRRRVNEWEKKKSCPMWYCVNTYGNSGLADSPKNH